MNPNDIIEKLRQIDQKQYSKDLLSQFKGYYNHGNCCFIISWLQAVFCSDVFVDEIKKQNNITMTKTCQLLIQILQTLESPKNKDKNINIKDFINQYNGWMGAYCLPKDENQILEPQDVSEFHLSVINSLNEQVKAVFLLEIEKNIINKQRISQNVKIEKELMMILNIGSGSIHKSIQEYFQPEENQGVKISIKVQTYPQVLCLSLGRVQKDFTKNTQVIQIPLFLNLSQYCAEIHNGTPYYELLSICLHIGDEVDDGHWVTLKKILGHWILCDDKKIQLLEQNPKFRGIALKELEELIMRNASFCVYQSTNEEQHLEAQFSLTHTEIIPLHQNQVIMNCHEMQNYEPVMHTQLQNPIDVEKSFPTLCGKLYIQGGEIPTCVIHTPSESEWKLFTSFIKAGQVVLSDETWKKTDVGRINRDATFKKLLQDQFYQSDFNIQIAEQAECIINLYNEYLLRRAKSISEEDFIKFFSQQLNTMEKHKDNDDLNENKEMNPIIKYDEASSSDSECRNDVVVEKLYDKISSMNIHKTIENDAEYDDNHIEDSYDWRNRCKILNIQELLTEIRKKITEKNRKKQPNKKLPLGTQKEAIKQQFIEYYITKRRNFVSDRQLILDWLSSRKELNIKNRNCWVPSYNTCKSWILKFKNSINDDKRPIVFKKPRGKITEEVILCVITTLMDYPHWSGVKRTEFLNKKSGLFIQECFHSDKSDFPDEGIQHDAISVRSVNRLISMLDFKVKSLKFSPPARNTIGLMILRAFWASIVLEIASLSNIIFMFVDEAAVTLLPETIKGRALVGVVPVVEGILSKRKLSILSCVVPGFGVISKWFRGSVKGKDYALFIREVTDLIRRAVCSGSSKLCLIHDNCRIHKNSETQIAIQEMRLTELPTVPYSPHLNEVVEAYFGFQKTEMANFETNALFLDDSLEQEIKERWSMAENKFTPKISERFYAKWISILEMCKKGFPLTSQSIHCDAQYLTSLRNNVLTYRKIGGK